jgi:tRNAThr (cytosine32-N3)-methyltransferase
MPTTEPHTEEKAIELVATTVRASSLAEFGNRQLTDSDDVFAQNAWDRVEWGPENVAEAMEHIARQLRDPVPESKAGDYNSDPASYWNAFYANNTTKFFKNRHWLKHEFPELFKDGVAIVLEIGCGVGNTVFPFLESSKAFAYCCDYSSEAIDIVKVSLICFVARVVV